MNDQRTAGRRGQELDQRGELVIFEIVSHDLAQAGLLFLQYLIIFVLSDPLGGFLRSLSLICRAVFLLRDASTCPDNRSFPCLTISAAKLEFVSNIFPHSSVVYAKG